MSNIEDTIDKLRDYRQTRFSMHERNEIADKLQALVDYLNEDSGTYAPDIWEILDGPLPGL